MAMIKGISVTLHERIQNGTDPLGNPIYEEATSVVNNVLVAPTTSTDIVDNTEIDGAKAGYTLAIPKGDTHDWQNAIIEFWGKRWKAYGMHLEGIETNIPLEWNKKVTVERIE